MSRPVPILLIHKIVEQNFTTSQIEEYFGKKWNILQQELEQFLKNEPCGEMKLESLLSQLKKNDSRLIEDDLER